MIYFLCSFHILSFSLGQPVGCFPCQKKQLLKLFQCWLKQSQKQFVGPTFHTSPFCIAERKPQWASALRQRRSSKSFNISWVWNVLRLKYEKNLQPLSSFVLMWVPYFTHALFEFLDIKSSLPSICQSKALPNMEAYVIRVTLMRSCPDLLLTSYRISQQLE